MIATDLAFSPLIFRAIVFLRAWHVPQRFARIVADGSNSW